MKLTSYSMFIILIIIAMLAVSGCSGGSATINPTPTVGPGSPGGDGTPTPAATVKATATPTPSPSEPATLSDLYSKSKFTWLEYTTTTSLMGQTVTMTIKTEKLSPETHDGKMMDHWRVTSNGVAQDTWIDPANPADESKLGFLASKDPLTKVGPESVTVKGKTYSCTKYTATVTTDNGPAQYTYWVSPEVPAPVQYAVTTGSATASTQLTGWG